MPTIHVQPHVPPPDSLRKLLAPPLLALCTSRELAKGECLFRQRQRPRHMHFVVSGEIVLERTGEAGDPVVLQRVRQGFVAEASLHAASYHCDAVVTTPGSAMVVPLDALRQHLTQEPAFAQRWIAMLNTEVRRLRSQCERLSLKGVADRLLHLVETEGANGRLAIGSGLKSLATELAVSHEALYRTLATLEQQRVVERRDGHLVLLVKPSLKQRS